MRKDVYVLSGAERRNGYVSGCFYELARTVIEDGGIAVGAAYSEDFSVRHVEINSAEQLKRITGVKYPESHIGKEIRERIKSYLESGRKVIFAGTPCQVESIYQDLHEKYDNLLTISVGCSGVIDPKVWKDYVTETQSYGSVISEIYCPYRGMFGISQRKILIRFSHGTAYFRDRKEDILLRLRDAGLIFKKECYQCPWTQGYDKADISLEIYRESVEKETVREEGLTKASVYTAKGKKLLLSSKSRLCIYNCSVNNGKIQTQKPVMPSNYNYFWNYYNNYDYLFAANLMASESDSSLQNKVMLDFLKKCMILDARGISLKKVLENWGLESVVLYGDGDVDKIIEDKLRREQIIVRSFEHITESNQPVLVSPTCFIPDVIARMKEAGTDKKRLLPLQLLISQEYDYHILNGANHTVWNRDSNGIGDIYLITGAQFGNKGAQSMLFVAVSELRRKYPDCDIYYLPIDTMENYPDSIVRRYRFH
ncbi:MAG: hypothetical protein HFH87_08790, partial [Lachnospiraceae bacterium]|nr:hypothetical protein [Lachnospiraceae bacterium]